MAKAFKCHHCGSTVYTQQTGFRTSQGIFVDFEVAQRFCAKCGRIEGTSQSASDGLDFDYIEKLHNRLDGSKNAPDEDVE